MTVRTRHGAFVFRRRRFVTPEGENICLFSDVLSASLHARCLDWACSFPFSQVARLLTEFCGQSLLSEDTLWRLCQKQARRLEEEQGQALCIEEDTSAAPLALPTFVAATDIYQGEAEEFVTLTDAICVASQKPTRQKAGQEKEPKQAKRHDTDVWVLPRRDGGEQFFCEGISEKGSCVAQVAAFVRREWAGKSLSVVAITDGAKKIRTDLACVFGQEVRVILDWYHLAKRVRENLSMMAHSMTEREAWEAHVLPLLWLGNVAAATRFMSGLAARREKAKADLLGYLDKHEAEIIDYGRRQKVGKPIGSGRMEKAVDQVVGVRQKNRGKNRGMSWTKAGSRALALLTVAKLNARQTAPRSVAV